MEHRTLIVLAFILLIGACATVPETGRKQLLLITSTEETSLGLSEFEKLKKAKPISQNASLRTMVERVGMRIASVAPLPNARWEFVLFEDPKTPNAFCLPGGKVGIFTGLLPIARDDAGLATVIGHEVAHAVARHGAERISEGLLLEFGGQILQTALRTRPDAAKSLILGAYGIGGELAVSLPHSRKQELEADHLGLLYMARGGYDPREALSFWERFSAYGKQSGGRSVEFLSTHPLDERRMAELEKLMPQALQDYAKTKTQ
ncbi:MAG: M48 family metallopeptidase [Gammaproteobacteria bacterium]|nr:M48 family metallopeptidase [Gammaproteobacteria bacterium]